VQVGGAGSVPWPELGACTMSKTHKGNTQISDAKTKRITNIRLVTDIVVARH
jgi:hypothetical protein